MKKLRVILIIVLALIFAFSAWQILGIMGKYKAGQDSYESLDQYVSFAPETPKPSMAQPVGGEGEETAASEEAEPDDTIWPVVDFEELAAINPDVVGWIFIEGTNVNYPVVQGEDNSYYLNHLFNGLYNDSGCIFLDAANSSDFSDIHSVVYGHHMNDKSMFYTLDNYKNQEFYDGHSLALLVTPSHKYKIRIFSAYIADIKANAWITDFTNWNYGEWLASVVDDSELESPYIPDENAQILTLSTCSYEFPQAKLVVHGYVERVFENG